MTAQQRSPAVSSTRILADVLCGIDGTRSAFEAVRQAAWLTGADGHLALLAASAVTGSGRYRTAAVAPVRARRALDHARRIAREAGVSSSPEVEERGPVVEVLLDRARGHGVLALGAPKMSRLAHLLVGGIATVAAHVLPCSLLVARRPPASIAFGERIMVASDGLSGSDALVDFAAQLAQQRRASLVLLHAVRSESASHPTRIAAQAERVRRALSSRSDVRVEPGRAHDVIVETATHERVSLIVMSSRRGSGLRALGSVSERVVHQALCSVLVVRPEDLLP
jgi:nucleotide-binding universal stress UspA family protein